MLTPFERRFQSYGIQSMFNADREMKSEAMNSNNYTIPDISKRLYDHNNRFRTMMDYAKKTYLDEANDPSSDESRYLLGDFVQQLMPGMSLEEAAEYGQDLIYYATGYKGTPDSLWEHLSNTFYSNASGMAAGMDAAALYIEGALRGFNADWREKRDRRLAAIYDRYASNYRTDNIFNDSIFENILTSTAALAPSTILSLATAAPGIAFAKITGTAAATRLRSFLGTLGQRSLVGNIITGTSLAARYASVGFIEMGGTILDIHNAGGSDDVALGVGAVVGLINGVVETVGDKAIDNLLKPFTEVTSKKGRKLLSRSIGDSVKRILREKRNELGESIISETSTEVIQNVVSMLGYNIAATIENNRGLFPENLRKYTADDFGKAIWETIVQTAQGTLGLGLTSAGLSTARSFVNGELRQQIRSERYTSSEGADHMTNTRSIILDEGMTTDTDEEYFENTKASPVQVVAVGDRFYPIDPSDEQIFAIRNSKTVYTNVIDMSTEKAMDSTIAGISMTGHLDDMRPMKISAINDAIRKGLKNGAIEGFSYYDSDMNRIEPSDKASYVSIKSSSDDNAVMIKTAEENSITPEAFEAALYGETFDKIRTEEPSVDTDEAETAEADSEEDTGEGAVSAPKEPSNKDTVSITISETEKMGAESESTAESFLDDDPYEELIRDEDISAEETAESEAGVEEASRLIDEAMADTETEEFAEASSSENDSEITDTQAPTVQESPVSEAPDASAKADADTDRRIRDAEARNAFQNEWDDIKRQLTGTDSRRDADVLADHFRKKLRDTDMARNPAVLDSVAKASAAVMVGFARASGIAGNDYYNTLEGIFYNAEAPVEGNSYSGWFNPDQMDRYISIMKNAEPTTLIHELAHHFLSVISDSNPAYAIVRNVYSSEFESDGGKIGVNTQEAFARDLEKYVYLRKSSNPSLNGIFQTLYDVAKSLWRLLSPDASISPEKKAMFDAIFYDEASEASAVSVIKADIDAEDSPAPISTAVKNTLPETEPIKTAEEAASEIIDQAEFIADKSEERALDAEAPEAVTEDKPIILNTEAEPVFEVTENDTVIDIPQTEEEKNLDEPEKKYVIPQGYDFSMPEGFIDEVDDTDGKNIFSMMKSGKIDSKKIAAELKEIIAGRKPEEMLQTINKQIIREAPVKMENRTSVYKYLSGLMGTEIGPDTVEFYYGKNGGIYVNLKKDIRTNPETGKNFTLPKRASRWFLIPFSHDTKISVSEALETWTGYNLLEKDSDEFGRIKEDFSGYSSQEIAAIAFAYLYDQASYAHSESRMLEGYPQILFSSDPSEQIANLRSTAMNTVLNLNSSTMFRSYSSFMKLMNETADNAGKQFDRDEKNRLKGADEAEIARLSMDHDERRDWEIRKARAEAVGGNPESGMSEMFASYLDQHIDDLGLSDDIKSLGPEERSIFLKELGNALVYTGNSYSALAQVLREGFNNEKKYNKAVDLLRNMIQSARKGSNSDKLGRDIGEMLKGSGFSVAWNNVWNAFKGGKNSSTASNDDIRLAINALINPEDGSVRGLQKDAEGRLTAPLIILANYYANYAEGKPTSKDSFAYADDTYLMISDSILRERQGISSDSLEGNVPEAIKKMRDTLRSVSEDKSLASLFSRATSFDYINSFAETFKAKIDELRSQLSSKEISPEIKKDIEALKKSRNDLEKTVKALEKKLEKAGNDKDKLSAAIKELREENKEQSHLIDRFGGRESLESIRDEMANMKRQIAQRDNRIKALETDSTARMQKLREKIRLMENLPAYMTAKELKEQHDSAIAAIKSRAASGNARVSGQLANILNALNKRKGTVISPELFESAFEDYIGWYDELRAFAEKSGMIADGKLAKRFSSLNLTELSELADLVEDVRERGIVKYDEERAERTRMWDSLEKNVIRSLPKLGLTMASEEQIKKALDEIRLDITEGSASTLQYDAIKKLMSQTIQIETELKSISPALHDMIFGGVVNNQYVKNNINNAQNLKDKYTAERKKKISKAFEDIFGEKAGDFDIVFERVFTKDLMKIGNMTPEEFAERNNISWGNLSRKGDSLSIVLNNSLDPALKAIDSRILNAQKNLTKAEISGNATAYNNYKTVMNKENANDFTWQQMMGIYLLSQQADGLNRLIISMDNTEKTNHLSIGNVLWVIDQFRNNPEYEKYRRFADRLSEITGERYNEIAEVYFRQNNEILKKVMNYFPIRDSVPAIVRELAEEGALTSKGKIRANFIEERTHSSNAADLNAVSVAIRTIEDQENYIAFQEIHDEFASRFAEGSDLRTAFEKVYGTNGKLLMDNLSTWIDRVSGIQDTKPSKLEKIFGIIRRNRARSVLWMSPSVLLQQVPTYVLTAKEVGFIKATEGLLSYIENRKESDEFIYRHSPQMRQRARLDIENYNALTVTDTMSRTIHDYLQKHDPNNIFIRSKEGFRRYVRWGMNVAQGLDRGVANAMWLTMFNDNIEKMQSQRTPEMTDAEYTEMVANYTTQRVMSMQSSQNAKDNALIYSERSEAIKMLLQFTSQLNKQFNMLYGSAADIKRNGMSKQRLEDLAEAVLTVGIVTAAAAFISGKNLPNEDDDSWWDVIWTAIKGTAIDSTSMIPLVGGLISSTLSGEQYYDTNILNSIINLKNVLFKDEDERRDNQLGRAIRNVARELAYLAGVPFGLPSKIWNAFMDEEVGFNAGELLGARWGDMYRRAF